MNFFLAVEPWTGAERQGKRPENSGRTLEEMRRLSDERQNEERKRYRALYDIDDHLARRHYDFIINTTNLTEDQTFACVMALIDVKLK